MLTSIQIETMAKLQNSINESVNIDWMHEENDWLLAASMECAEAIDHYGWKWWKHHEPDLAQVQMELVDIWHFVLSKAVIESENERITVQSYLSPEGLSYVEFDEKRYYLIYLTLIKSLKILMSLMAVNKFNSDLFFHICKLAKLPSEDLYKQYLGKNVLNFFRQNNGYKEGTYKKTWFDSREDNEHLVDVLKVVNIHVENADKQIYSMLSDLYDKNY